MPPRIASRLGGVGEDRQPIVCGEIETVEVQAELADDWVMEVLDAGVVEAHVVGGPVGTECFAAGFELADKVGELAVVRVAPGCPAQNCHAPLAARSQSP